jgi:hypothetical protein
MCALMVKEILLMYSSSLQIFYATVQPFAPSNADSTLNKDKDKYPVDDIMDLTPCTLIYVKDRTSRTIKVAQATVMPRCILHGRPISVECAMVEVTTIR